MTKLNKKKINRNPVLCGCSKNNSIFFGRVIYVVILVQFVLSHLQKGSFAFVFFQHSFSLNQISTKMKEYCTLRLLIYTNGPNEQGLFSYYAFFRSIQIVIIHNNNRLRITLLSKKKNDYDDSLSFCVYCKHFFPSSF